MVEEQLAGLPLGLYRIHWKADEGGGSSVAAVGHTAEGRYWFAPTNWIYRADGPGAPTLPSFDWAVVEKLELIAVQRPTRWDTSQGALNLLDAVEIVNSYGKTEPCCECGEEYPRADLIRGYVLCPKCRGLNNELGR